MRRFPGVWKLALLRLPSRDGSLSLALLSLFLSFLFCPTSFWRQWADFLGAWWPQLAIRSCFVKFALRSVIFSMNLLGRKWSPRPIPPPSWLLPVSWIFRFKSAGGGLTHLIHSKSLWYLVKALEDSGFFTTVKNTEDTRDVGLTPGSGRSPGGGNGNPLQYILAWKTSWGHKRVSNWAQTHTLKTAETTSDADCLLASHVLGLYSTLQGE